MKSGRNTGFPHPLTPDYSADSSSTSTNSSSPPVRDDFLDHLAATLEDGVGDAAGIEPDGAGGVVITRDDVTDAVRGVVGIDHADDRNAQLAGLGDGNLVVADVDDENGIGQTAHVLDAANGFLKLFQFAAESQGFPSWASFPDRRLTASSMSRRRLIEVLTVLNWSACRPASADRHRHAGALGFLGHDFPSLPLGADEKDVCP